MQTLYIIQILGRVSSYKVKKNQIVRYQCIFKYKIENNDYLQKYKAKLIVCKNHQKYYGLLFRAITLAITFLCLLLAIIIKFDLETIQFENVNSFIYADFD